MTDFKASDRDVNRAIRSWLHEDRHEDVSRIAGAVLDQVETTRQRRSWWPARRSESMNTYAKFALAAAAVLVIAVVGYNFLPGQAGVGGPTATPSPASLAFGNFISHGGQIELDATGEGSNVTGSMTYADVGIEDARPLRGRSRVHPNDRQRPDLDRRIGHRHDERRQGRVGGQQRRDRPQAGIAREGGPRLELPEPHEASCPAFLESIPDEGDPGFESERLGADRRDHRAPTVGQDRQPRDPHRPPAISPAVARRPEPC